MSQILISYNQRFLFKDSTIISALDIHGNVPPKSIHPRRPLNFDVRGSELTPNRDELFTARYKGLAKAIQKNIFFDLNISRLCFR